MHTWLIVSRRHFPPYPCCLNLVCPCRGSEVGCFPPCAARIACRGALPLRAALLREAVAHPLRLVLTPSPPKMRSLSKYALSRETVVPRRGMISLRRSGSVRKPPSRRFDTLSAHTFVSCHLPLRWWFPPHPTRLDPFPSSGWVCAACRALPDSCHPLAQRWRLGFLRRMGTAEGAVGQASPRLSHPACSHASPDPRELVSAALLPHTPSRRQCPPSLRGRVRLCLGAGTVRTERAAAPAAPAEPWCISESKSDAAALYITDQMGFVGLAYILMLQLSLAASEACKLPLCSCYVFLFLKEKIVFFPLFPIFSSEGLNIVSFILEQEGFLVVCGVNGRGIVPTFGWAEERICFLDYPLPVLKSLCVTSSTCMSTCTHTLGAGQISAKGYGCLSRQI